MPRIARLVQDRHTEPKKNVQTRWFGRFSFCCVLVELREPATAARSDAGSRFDNEEQGGKVYFSERNDGIFG